MAGAKLEVDAIVRLRVLPDRKARHGAPQMYPFFVKVQFSRIVTRRSETQATCFLPEVAVDWVAVLNASPRRSRYGWCHEQLHA